MARIQILGMCALWDMTLGQVTDTPLSHEKQLCEILSRSNMAMKSYGLDTDFRYVCTVTLTLEVHLYNLESRSWHTLESWTTIVWNIIQIQLGTEELWPGHGFLVCVHCDLDLGGITLGQGHDTPLSHEQQSCEILSKSNLTLRSYGPDTDFWYGCTMTSEIWPWVKVMTHPWSWTTIVCNIIQIQQSSEKLWPGHGFSVFVHYDFDLGDMILGQGHDTPLGHGQQLCVILSREDKGVRSYGPDTMWTDGQTGWFLYTPGV